MTMFLMIKSYRSCFTIPAISSPTPIVYHVATADPVISPIITINVTVWLASTITKTVSFPSLSNLSTFSA